ncbi:MAG: TIGR02206 family membrane protein, partial [Ignavibacteriae bacterium]|nr:TIGR02206 family membrane protein [Ignavibacteriota bacterium]
MPDNFSIFSIEHCIILATIPASVVFLLFLSGFHYVKARTIQIALAISLFVVEVIWYVFVVIQGWFRFPEDIPLQLCDVTLWLTVVSVLCKNKFAFELAFYWGLGGTTMALLTPDLGFQLPSYPALQFFLSHGMVLIIILFTVFSGL